MMTRSFLKLRGGLVVAALVALVGVAWSQSVGAQATFAQTNLTVAVTTPTSTQPATTTVYVKATGSMAVGWVLFVDTEAMQVTSVGTTVTNGGYAIRVIRGSNGTVAQPHTKGAVVWSAPGNYYSGITPFGACTSTQTQVQPVMNTSNGVLSRCIDGRWTGTFLNPMAYMTLPRTEAPGTGAYSATLSDVLIVYATLTGYATVTLPSSSGIAGHVIIVKDESPNVISSSSRFITIIPPSGYTIDGSTAGTSIRVSYGVLRFYSSGTNWFSW